MKRNEKTKDENNKKNTNAHWNIRFRDEEI